MKSYSMLIAIPNILTRVYKLCGESSVVHEEEINIADIADKESFVSGWHHVAGFLV